jgi:hypothetical protein
LGEAHARAGSTFVALHDNRHVTNWQPWTDYSLAVAGVFALPCDSDLDQQESVDSVSIWRHLAYDWDSSFVTYAGVSERHAQDIPPPGRDITYGWNDSDGRRVAEYSATIAHATALEWTGFEPGTTGIRDGSRLSATLQNWSDSTLSVSVSVHVFWSDDSLLSGPLPEIQPDDSAFQLSPRSSVTVQLVAAVGDGAHGQAVVEINAFDSSELHAWPARLFRPLSVGTTGIDERGSARESAPAPWPNPCRGVLHIPDGASFVLVNLLGRRVAEYRSEPGTTGATWDLADLRLPAGAYWLRVHDQRGIRVHKLTLLK